MEYDSSKQYIDANAISEYISTDKDTTKKYGLKVRAISISNREYQRRFDKLNSSRKMRPPPSNNRIFPGYLVIRNIGKSSEYETWLPDDVFEEIYKLFYE